METAFNDLSTEHRQFLALLDRWESRPPSREELGAFLDFLGNVHHAKEERFLFPLLLGTDALAVGGPKCMTFFTPRVIGAEWKDPFRALAESLPGGVPVPDTPFRRRVFESNSMLKIPVEDHQVGAAAGELLLAKLGTPEGAELLSKFSACLRDHIRREEECLLPMFRRTVGAAEAERYRREAAKFDKLAPLPGDA